MSSKKTPNKGSANPRGQPKEEEKPTPKDPLSALTDARERVRTAREEHKKKIWEKLDEAKRKADEKRPRIGRFSSRGS